MDLPRRPDDSGYRTINVLEHHRLGPDRLPIWHETTQTLHAENAPLIFYPYTFDTRTAAHVEALFGVEAAEISPVPDLPDFATARLEFPTPVEPGESVSFRYRTILDYDEAPPPEFRRGSRHLVEGIGIRIEFDELQLPHSYLTAASELSGIIPTGRQSNCSRPSSTVIFRSTLTPSRYGSTDRLSVDLGQRPLI